MPCILKQRTARSPGIITFTSGEVMAGVVAKSRRVRRFLRIAARKRQWIVGTHIQGDFSWLDAWPDWEWQSFVMWPEASAAFLRQLPPEKRVPLNCINFLSEPGIRLPPERRRDIVVVSRPTQIKRLAASIKMIRRLLDFRPDLKAAIIAPDPRNVALGRAGYPRNLDLEVFQLPRHIFTAAQLKNVSFLFAPAEEFGRFPVSSDLVQEIVAGSKFLLLTSHSEGTPKVLAEALIVGTPCVVSRSLRSGMEKYFNEHNAVIIDDDVETAARQIDEALTNYQRFQVDVDGCRHSFCEADNVEALRAYLTELLTRGGATIEGAWYLDDLPLRLSCHGQKHDCQLENNAELFFEWLHRVEAGDPYDEDSVAGDLAARDRATLLSKLTAKGIAWRHGLRRRTRAAKLIRSVH